MQQELSTDWEEMDLPARKIFYRRLGHTLEFRIETTEDKDWTFDTLMKAGLEIDMKKLDPGQKLGTTQYRFEVDSFHAAKRYKTFLQKLWLLIRFEPTIEIRKKRIIVDAPDWIDVKDLNAKLILRFDQVFVPILI